MKTLRFNGKITYQFFFYAAFFVFIVHRILWQSLYTTILPARVFHLMDYLCMLFVVARILLLGNRFRKRELAIYAVFVIFALLVVRAGYSSRYLTMFLLIIAAKDIDFEQTIKVSLCATTLALLAVLLGCKLGILQDLTWARYIFGKQAHGLGFSYYSYPATYVFSVSCMYLYLRRKKYTLLELIVLFALQYYVYSYSSSRLYVYAFAALVIMCVLYKHHILKFEKKIWTYILFAMFPFFQIVILLLTKLYASGNQHLAAVDVVFSGRMALMSTALETYGIHFLPYYIKMIGGAENAGAAYFYIDSGYMYIALCFGVVGIVVVNGIYIALFRKCLKSEDKFLCIWLIVICVMCICNNFIFSLILNPITLLIPSIVKDWDVWENERLGRKHNERDKCKNNYRYGSPV